VKVIPNSSKDEIVGKEEDGSLKIRVQSPPVEGAANKRLVVFLSKKLCVPKSSIRIVSGESSRRKVIEIEGSDNKIFDTLMR